MYFYNYRFRRRKKPSTIQMPITSRCNSRCKTCNIWKCDNHDDIDASELEKALKDDFFSEVTGVGLNGGEFTLVPNFLDIVKAVLTLPNIKSVYLISNGLYPKRLFEYLELANSLCVEHQVSLHICISVDGVGQVHEIVRGVPNCFDKTKFVLDELTRNSTRYCSSYSVGCTISIYNVDSIKETCLFLSQYKGLPVEYHCAIPNKRIKTFEDADYYVVNNTQKRLLAAEFFHEMYRNESSYAKRLQYFVNYYFLKSGGKHRLTTCDYVNRDVTIDENLNFMLCATASDVIGNLKEKSASELIKTKRAKQVLDDVCGNCDSCIHYSYYPLNFKGRLAYIREEIVTGFALDYYKTYSHEGWLNRFLDKVRLCLRITKSCFRNIYFLLWKLR